MLETLITSKTRIKLILKFFLNPENNAYLRGLADELSESSNAIRVELNRLTEAGLLELMNNGGRTKLYKANKKHPFFTDLHNIVKKNLGVDKLIDTILAKLGNIELAFITGDYARGIDTGIIDLVIIGNIDKNYLQVLIDKTENIIKRKIRPLILVKEEYDMHKTTLELDTALVVWNKGA